MYLVRINKVISFRPLTEVEVANFQSDSISTNGYLSEIFQTLKAQDGHCGYSASFQYIKE